jgi:hypothetical protein
VQNGGTVACYAFRSSAVPITLELLAPEPGPWLQALAIAGACVLGRYLVLRLWVLDETVR